MNLKEYIASGKLETYVLGGLSDAESREVERFAKEYPEIAHELQKLRNSIEHYAESIAVTPRFEIKDRLLKTIGAETRIVKFTPILKWSLVASLALVLVLAFTTLYLGSQAAILENEMAQVNRIQDSLKSEINLRAKQVEEYNSLLASISDSNVVKVDLKGTNLAPSAKATVYWNVLTEQVFLTPKGLPEIPSNKQFQVWAIIDGSAVDIGLIDQQTTQVYIKLKNASRVQAFAITLELKGGSPYPTLENMYVLGSRG